MFLDDRRTFFILLLYSREKQMCEIMSSVSGGRWSCHGRKVGIEQNSLHQSRQISSTWVFRKIVPLLCWVAGPKQAASKDVIMSSCLPSSAVHSELAFLTMGNLRSQCCSIWCITALDETAAREDMLLRYIWSQHCGSVTESDLMYKVPVGVIMMQEATWAQHWPFWSVFPKTEVVVVPSALTH